MHFKNRHFGRRLVRVLAAITVLIPVSVGFEIGVASAHQIGENNGISVILHVDPDDLPVAGVVSTLNLYYGTSLPGTSFNITRCDCTLVVKDGAGKIISNTKVEADPGSGTEANTNVTFPRLGVYALTIAGSSSNHSFPSFSVPFNVRVAVASQAASKTTALIEQIVIGLTAIGAIVGFGIWQWRAWRPVKAKTAKKSA